MQYRVPQAGTLLQRAARGLACLRRAESPGEELDHRKDQVTTVCKVALANLAMWVRDHYFPSSYAQATWKRLLPFFQLPGTITQDAQMVRVELLSFNDRVLNRDLAVLCEQVNQVSPRLPDGRRLSFTMRPACCILPAQKLPKISGHPVHPTRERRFATLHDIFHAGYARGHSLMRWP